MGDWRISFTATAAKALTRLPAAEQIRLRDAIDRLMDGDVKKLRGRRNHYRLRLGALRVVFMPDFQSHQIVVFDIFPRGHGYR